MIFYLLKASVKINSVPTPTVLTTSIVSLCACKISLVIESPRPEPFLSRPRDASDLYKRSQILSRLSFEIPEPLSLTEI